MRTLAVAALLASAPAWAQDRPPLLPTRDVDVTYHANFGNRSFDQRWRYRAADQLLRLDLPDRGNYMIADHRAHTATMVSDSDRSALDLPLPNTDPAGLPQGQAFTRLGTDTVAGLPCTEWQTRDMSGADTVACVTADGVMLRARHGGQVIVQATRVSYGPLDPAAFSVPSGYKREGPPARR